MVRGKHMTFKATLQKLTELPWNKFKELFTWPSKGLIQADNPALKVARVTKEDGEVVLYATCERVLLVDSYVCNPHCVESEASQASVVLDTTIKSEAEQTGIARILIVLPDETPSVPDEKFIRVVERKVPQRITTQQTFESMDSPSAFIN